MVAEYTNLPLDICISIAGLPTRLIFHNPNEKIYTQIIEWYTPFRISPHPHIPIVTISVEPGEIFLPHFGGMLQIKTQRRESRIDYVSHDEIGWFDQLANRGELVMRPKGNPENYLRVLYAWRCLDAGALLLHSSGMIRHGRGYVFFGHSGSGKTTITRLSPDAQILSDDLVIIKSTDANGQPGVDVIGVPFRGEMAEAPRTNASAPLHGLFALEKAEQPMLTDLSNSEAVGRISAAVPFVMASPTEAARVVQLCTEIVRCVQVRTLHFRRDPGFWSLIDA